MKFTIPGLGDSILRNILSVISMEHLPNWAKKGRSQWEYYGQKRPSFAIKPSRDQESVWDYPRPPKLDHSSEHIVVKLGKHIIADTTHSIRILETASPPTYYLPNDDLNFNFLKKASGTSLCEWKGTAVYWDIITPTDILSRSGWSYPEPFSDYKDIADYVSFYPKQLECYVNDERVKPQPGGFYGGWITNKIVGPVKGEDPRAYL